MLHSSTMTSLQAHAGRVLRTVPWRLINNIGLLMMFAIAVGTALRLAAWWNNRSFWLDEIYLALNITNRSFAELWRPLDHDQGAPIGFLMLVKTATMFFGTSEWALRLIPLAAGVGAMLLFPIVARRWLPPAGACFATLLFAVTPKLIYYSSELKQYSSDVFVMILLLWAASRPERYRVLAILGAIVVWFSHPAIFILAAIGIVLFCRADAPSRKRLVFVGMTWVFSFGVCYLVCLRELSKNQYLLNYWTEYFAPMPPRNFEQAGWYLRAVGWLFEGPAGMTLADVSFAIPAVMLFVAGLWYPSRVWPIMLLTLTFALLASMLNRYPFGGRLLLFAVPLLHLGLGAGWEALRPGWRDVPSKLCLALCAAVFIAPAASAIQQLAQRKVTEDHRAAIEYLSEHWQAGDGVYLSAMAREPFLYYGKQFGIDVDTAVLGQPNRDDWDSVSSDITSLKGRNRVWVFIAHERGANHQFTTWQLDQHGAKLQSKSFPGTAVYLYDLSVAR
jgi:hypothetical protein